MKRSNAMDSSRAMNRRSGWVANRRSRREASPAAGLSSQIEASKSGSEYRPALAALAFLALVSAGCAVAPPTETTIPNAASLGSDGPGDTVVVMLPGRGDRAEAFAVAGFEQPGLSNDFDSIAVDAHLGYYLEGSLMDRLHEDVVLPARERGSDKVWLLGISMGGLGALLYATEHPDQVDGLILLAPYLGDRRLIEAIVDAGGVDALGDRANDFEDYELAIWSYLLDESGAGRPPVLLGYGLDDRMARGYEAAMGLIEPAAVFTREGGHRWTTWRPLWDEIASEIDEF